MRRMAIIRNPTAGRGAGERDWPQIRSLLESYKAGWQIEHIVTVPGSITTQATEAVEAGNEVVVACGGDGTIMQVACGLIGTDVALGMIPVGTGNDFCRTLGLHGSYPKAVKTLFTSEPQWIDAVRWRCQDREGTFINVAGTGFDAIVATRINSGYRLLRGTTAYLAAVIQTLATYRSANLRVCIDGRTVQTDAMLCAVANATCYGGGMKIAPDAKLSDGLMDLVIVQGVGKVEFLRAFPRVFKGTHVTHPKVTISQGREIEIESDPVMPVFADGELVGQTPVSFTMQPSALRILAP